MSFGLALNDRVDGEKPRLHRDREMPADNVQKEELKTRLEEACKDLWWSSESDYPVEVVWQPEVAVSAGAVSETMDDWVREHHLEDNIEKVEINDFFERATMPRSWHTHEDKVQLSRLQQLKDLLIAELSSLQVYRCGEVEIKAYVLGCSADNVLAGFQTLIVET